MKAEEKKHTITVEMSRDEALVMFDWVSGKNRNSNQALFSHKSESWVLDRLEGCFEKALSDPFDPNYEMLLENARKRLLSDDEENLT